MCLYIERRGRWSTRNVCERPSRCDNAVSGKSADSQNIYYDESMEWNKDATFFSGLQTWVVIHTRSSPSENFQRQSYTYTVLCAHQFDGDWCRIATSRQYSTRIEKQCLRVCNANAGPATHKKNAVGFLLESDVRLATPHTNPSISIASKDIIQPTHSLWMSRRHLRL